MVLSLKYGQDFPAKDWRGYVKGVGGVLIDAKIFIKNNFYQRLTIVPSKELSPSANKVLFLQ